MSRSNIGLLKTLDSVYNYCNDGWGGGGGGGGGGGAPSSLPAMAGEVFVYTYNKVRVVGASSPKT